MGFADDINKFSKKAIEAIEDKKRDVDENAKRLLVQVLGEDVSLIKSISLDTDIAKFYDVVAPEGVIAKLREANLLKP